MGPKIPKSGPIFGFCPKIVIFVISLKIIKLQLIFKIGCVFDFCSCFANVLCNANDAMQKKILHPKKFFMRQKIFHPKKFFMRKKNLHPKKFFIPKNFLGSKKNFNPKKFFRSRKFSGLKITSLVGLSKKSWFGAAQTVYKIVILVLKHAAQKILHPKTFFRKKKFF